MDILPLYVKAGSIIPMGPLVEYATQKTDLPVELRIYPGADGQFTVYEDENDNYNYEKGKYATFTINWNDKTRSLTIGDTKGEFEGMLKHRTFNVIMVGQDHGANIGVTQTPDAVVKYDGRMTEIHL
jgi:alpha-D-xyloside xylohydrolase